MATSRTRRAWGLALVVAVGAGAGAWLWRAWPGLFPRPIERAQAAYERGEWAEAAAVARRVLKEEPAEKRAVRLLARSSAKLGRDDLAKALFGRLGAGAMDADDLLVLAGVLRRQGLAEEARTVIGSAYAEAPDRPEVMDEMGRGFAHRDHLAHAADLGRRLGRVPGWEARGRLMLGLVRAEQSDPEAAAEALVGALRSDPKLVGVSTSPAAVRKLLARCLLQTGKPAEAEAVLRVVLGQGTDPEGSWLLSRALLQQDRAAEAAEAWKRAKGYGEDQPHAFEPAEFVGSAACATCHAPIHRDQRSSRHARTFYAGGQVLDVIEPTGRPLDDPHGAGVAHAIEREGRAIRWETRHGDRALTALVEFAVGSGDRGLTPVARDSAGAYRELRLSRYGDIDGWDMTTGHHKHPAPDEVYLGEPLDEDAMRRCLGCHATNWRAALRRIEPLASETGFGCETCHGPGGNHLKARALNFPDEAIGRPSLATAAQVNAVCGRCHTPRGRTVDPADPSSIRFQSTTLTWSRCYTDGDGTLSCVTCHDPHRDAVTEAAYYEAKCLECHAAGGASDSPRRVACPVEPRRGCLDCHMPKASGTIPHTTFTDHHIRVHRKGAASE